MKQKIFSLNDEPQRLHEPLHAQEESPYANKRSRRWRWLAKFVLPVMLLCCLAYTTPAWGAIQGDGSEANPYLITNLDDLKEFKYCVEGMNGKNHNDYLGKYWKVTNNINWDNGTYATDNRIGYDGNHQFTGTFDGDGHTISFKSIDASTFDFVGFFGQTENAVIKNLTISYNYILGKKNSGGLIGEAIGSLTLENVHVQANDLDKSYSYEANWGGLIGQLYQAGTVNITFCSVIIKSLLFRSSASYAGGLIGRIYEGTPNVTITDCLADVGFGFYSSAYNGKKAIGGIIGEVNAGIVTLNRVFSRTSVPGPLGTNYQRGTMIGHISSNRTVYAYSTMNLTDINYLVGQNQGAWVAANNEKSANWESTSYVYSNLEHRDNKGSLLDIYMRGNERWGYDLKERPKLSKTGYAVQVFQGSGISDISGQRYKENKWYNYVNADQELTVTSSLSLTKRQRLKYTFTNYYGPSSGEPYSATMDGNQWKLTAKTNGRVDASIVNIPYPENLSGTFNKWTKTVSVYWKFNNAQSLDGHFYVYRRESQSTGSWTVLTNKDNNKGLIAYYGLGPYGMGMEYTSVYDIANNDLGKVFEYCVVFVEGGNQANPPDAPSDPLLNNNNYEIVNVNFTPELDNWTVTATADTSNITVSFTTDNRFTSSSDYKYAVLRSVNGGAYENWLNDQNFSSVTDYSHVDNTPSSRCDSYQYKVVISAFNTSFSKESEIVHITGSTKFAQNAPFKASKGEYANYVRLQWKVDRKSGGDSETYRVFRRVKTTNDNAAYIEMETITSNAATVYWNDVNALTGVYYEYKVTIYQVCNGNEAESVSITDIGFTQAFGTVSGRVTYGTGSAVQGVSILVRRSELQIGESQYHSLKSGGGGNKFEWKADSTYFNDIWTSKKWTLQFWVNPSETNTETAIIGYLGNIPISMTPVTDGYQIYTGFGGTTYKSEIIPTKHYSHIVITRDADNMKIYTVCDRDTNNITIKDTTFTYSKADLQTADSSIISFGHDLKGNIDEVRFWNRPLSRTEIERDYNRILVGNEDGLKGYWTLDDALSGHAFDMSRYGTVYNGNHATTNTLASDTIIPNEYQLALKGITNNDGSYQIGGIPYVGEGTKYSIVPSFGIHTFNPLQEFCYISPQSMVRDAINFTDISSFPVIGQVTYAGTNYPVEGVQISIDGVATSKDGKLIETDSEGNYTVDVPIGSHFITVSKEGHTFANGGRYPKNELQKENFQTSVSNMNFSDSTTVRLVGRVVGGNPQTDKPLGFGLSNANIGKATIMLQTNNSYKLNITNNDSIGVVADSLSSKISSKTTFMKHEGNFAMIKIETDSVTGEFLALLPPVPYSIFSLTAGDWSDSFTDGDDVDFFYSKYTFNINPNSNKRLEYTDTAKIVHYLTVHDSVKITRYNEPTIAVRDLGAAEGAFGDSVYVYRNTVDNFSDTIHLYEVKDGKVNYTFEYPFFSQKQQVYTWEISTYEKYINGENEDIVPLAGQTIKINNGLASGTMELNINTGEQIELTSSESEITLDDEGKKTFRFHTGFPKMSGPFLLSTTLSLDHNGKQIDWKPTKDGFQGYLLGQVPTKGQNFVTKGPDMIDIVLPDPPGSYSYSYIEKGSSISSSHESSFNFETSEIGALTMHLGPKLNLGEGLGVFLVKELETILDGKGTAGGKQTRGQGNRVEKTLMFNERISTSGNSAFVGTKADVYVGTSTNLLFGQVRQLSFYPKSLDETDYNQTGIAPVTDGKYNLFPKEIIAIGKEFATTFTYTQDYILNTLIPNTKVLRNSLIQYMENLPESSAGLNFIDDDGNKLDVIYLSSDSVTDPHFGEAGRYKAYYPVDAESANKLLDDVASYNSWIANWEKSIENNEEAKIGLFDDRSLLESSRMVSNRSFDAGVGISESVTAAYNNVTMKKETDVTLGEYAGTYGLKIAGMGFEESITVGRTNTWDDSWEDEISSSISFGFALSEDGGDLKGINDALTVDIYQPVADSMKSIVDGGKQNSPIKTLRGYTFRTRGGQTSCPYEPADSTLFYERDGKKQLLNYGTFQIEKPELYINRSQHPTAANIPSGREATFAVQMNNMSDTKNTVDYQLSIGGYSNKDGLSLSIDGTELTEEPRVYTIEYGKELEKTLKVRQTKQDVLDYENIELVLSSTCDGSEFTSSSAKIDVHFTPSSSPVTLRSDTKLANINGLKKGREAALKGGKIQFAISEYELNFKNFGCIHLQYRRATEENWITLHTFVNDINKSLFPDLDMSDTINEYIGDRASLSYDYGYTETEPSDGEYIFRAVTVSIIGTEQVLFASDEIEVVKDTKRPQIMGYPSPVNGILNAGDEISITFNENIQSGSLIGGLKGNFSITGIPNADKREEPTVGLAFTGTEMANTELPIYTNGSFSIEAWIKWKEKKAGTIFAYGEGKDTISLGLNDEGQVVVTIGSEITTSTWATPLTASEVFKYIGLSYNNNTVSVYAFQEKETLTFSHSFTQAPATRGRLYVGNTPNGGNGFTGAIAQLHFYDAEQLEADMAISKSETKPGTEPHLIGFWELEEAEGTVAADKARARHLKLNNTNWYIYPQGKSIALTGANDTYVSVPSSHFQLSDDFTWELWFNGGSQGAATLLSCGSTASIGFDADHKLNLTVVGANTQVLTANNLLDNKWHHLALSSKRSGTTNVLIDGMVTASFSSSAFGSTDLGGGFYYLGVRYNGQSVTPQYENYFKGNIDELRVWASALTNDAIRLNKNSKLRGNEAGLEAYYPFDQYEQQGESSIYNVVETTKDIATKYDATYDATLQGDATFNISTPPMKVCRPVKDIPFTFTASERKIVFNLTEEAYRIEGVTLSITAKEIMDMNNNVSDVLSWTAYVNRNPLRWNTDKIDLTMEHGTSQTFKASITNSGGVPADYFIDNLPSWLSVNSLAGTVQPLLPKELTFTIASGVNIGNYEASLALTGTNNLREILPITLKVTGQRPDWSVNPHDYEMSMNVTAQIQILGAYQEDEDDIIGVFIGDRCVGVASPKYFSEMNAYYTFITVYGDSVHKDQPLIFKLWDASAGRIYPQVESSIGEIKFVKDKLVGVPVPILLNALDITEQSIELKNGINWISVNQTSTAPSTFDQMKTALATVGQRIKGRDEYLDAPFGTAEMTISEKEMYQINVSQDYTMVLKGTPVNPITTEIPLSYEWNWIGYTPSVSMPVRSAIAGINAQSGDLLKSQSEGYMQYINSAGWIGSLSSMKPGSGYKYYYSSANQTSFHYPNATTLRSMELKSDEMPLPLKWIPDPYRYTNTMTLTAIVLDDATEIHSDLVEIAAFNGDECRGSALLQYIDGLEKPYLGFLMIYGEPGDNIRFKVYDHDKNAEYAASGPVNRFTSDGIYGDPLNPAIITIGSVTDIDRISDALRIYPNPVKDVLYIEHGQAKLDRLEIFNITGQALIRKDNFVEQSLHVSNLATGEYILKVTLNGETSVHKFIKQ